MNKKELASILQTKINKTIDETLTILTIIEENSNSEICIKEIEKILSISIEEATEIYTTTKNFIKKVLKERIKHPFKKDLNKDI